MSLEFLVDLINLSYKRKREKRKGGKDQVREVSRTHPFIN